MEGLQDQTGGRRVPGTPGARRAGSLWVSARELWESTAPPRPSAGTGGRAKAPGVHSRATHRLEPSHKARCPQHLTEQIRWFKVT